MYGGSGGGGLGRSLERRRVKRTPSRVLAKQRFPDPDLPAALATGRLAQLYRELYWAARVFQLWLRDEFEDVEMEEVDLSAIRYKPESLEALVGLTRFSRKEIQLMYRGFKQGSPNGIVSLQQFKEIYQQFFPQGDSSRYAAFVFNTFDRDGNGQISFEEFAIGLSILSKGSLEERLGWVFQLYDIQRRGAISQPDLHSVVSSVYDLMGKHVEPPLDDGAIDQHVDQVFRRLDHDQDGLVHKDDFLRSCTHDASITESLIAFDTKITSKAQT